MRGDQPEQQRKERAAGREAGAPGAGGAAARAGAGLPRRLLSATRPFALTRPQPPCPGADRPGAAPGVPAGLAPSGHAHRRAPTPEAVFPPGRSFRVSRGYAPGRGRAPTGSASPQRRRPTGRVASRRPQPLAAASWSCARPAWGRLLPGEPRAWNWSLLPKRAGSLINRGPFRSAIAANV